MANLRSGLRASKVRLKHLKLSKTSNRIQPIPGYSVNLNAACVSICVSDSQHSTAAPKQEETWLRDAEKEGEKGRI